MTNLVQGVTWTMACANFVQAQGVYRTLKTLKALKTLNLENLTLKTLRTLKRSVFS